MKKILEKLYKIQTEIKAPKEKKSAYYAYRNQEDILEAAKQLLAEYKCAINLSDEPYYNNGRFYIKATAKIMDSESGEIIEAVAYAMEPAEKKGMDLAQISGATSSYARKYALCGLLAIDNEKDPDSQNDRPIELKTNLTKPLAQIKTPEPTVFDKFATKSEAFDYMIIGINAERSVLIERLKTKFPNEWINLINMTKTELEALREKMK